jgi:hypothetical protein
MFGIGSLSDPFEVSYPFCNRDISAKAVRDPRLVAGEGVLVLVGVGQSNIANSENALYTPTNASKIDNLNVFDGGVYEGVAPLLGCGVHNVGGNWMVRLADKLITAGYCDRVILAPIARGSTLVADWAPGGFMHGNLGAVCRRLSAANLPISGFLWAQGESDHATSQSAYSADLNAVIEAVRDDGFNAPWLIGKSTYTAGTTSATIRAALSEVVGSNPNVYNGADTDSLGSSYRWDNVHYNATGADAVADLWVSPVQSRLTPA